MKLKQFHILSRVFVRLLWILYSNCDGAAEACFWFLPDWLLVWYVVLCSLDSKLVYASPYFGVVHDVLQKSFKFNPFEEMSCQLYCMYTVCTMFATSADEITETVPEILPFPQSHHRSVMQCRQTSSASPSASSSYLTVLRLTLSSDRTTGVCIGRPVT